MLRGGGKERQEVPENSSLVICSSSVSHVREGSQEFQTSLYYCAFARGKIKTWRRGPSLNPAEITAGSVLWPVCTQYYMFLNMNQGN